MLKTLYLYQKVPRKLKKNLLRKLRKANIKKTKLKIECRSRYAKRLEMFFLTFPESIIGETTSRVNTRASLNREKGMLALLSTLELKTIDEALSEDSLETAMDEELSQFTKNKV